MTIEHPDRLMAVWRAGFYIRAVGLPGTANWFHFALPTPVILNDRRLRAGSVMLRFRTGSADAWVEHVHVYDGDSKIAEHNDLRLSGEHPFERFEVAAQPEVQWGLGVSIGAAFGAEPLSHAMEFIAAGCDFIA